MKYFGLYFLVLLGFYQAKAQITVTNAVPYNSPSFLITNVFTGQNVTAFNVTFNGSPLNPTGAAADQVGFFSHGPLGTIGIDSGIVLSSGNISEVTGPVAAAGSGIHDPDLLAVAQSLPVTINPASAQIIGTNDAAILEFDFIAPTDTIQFEYVFASKEWPTWICSAFNDAFGFFISGPGITGPYSNNAQNVALIPGTTLPVTISSIHGGGGSCTTPRNSNLYNNTAGTIPMGTTFNFPGFTNVLTTDTMVVNPCDTFHMKLGICDAGSIAPPGGDAVLSSAVFLKAHSFVGKPIQILPAPSYTRYAQDTALYEGCGNVTMGFRRFSNIANGDTVHLDLSGTFINGVDVTFIPDSIVFAPGDDTVTLSFSVISDGLVEGLETLIVSIPPDTSFCAITDTNRVSFTISDALPMTFRLPKDTIINCAQHNIPLVVDSMNGFVPYSFNWSTGSTDTFIVVNPITTTTYTVSMVDACQNDSAVGSVTVTVFTPPYQASQFGNNQTISCISDSATMGIKIDQNWYSDIAYQWSDGSTDSLITKKPDQSTTYTVTVTLLCNGQQDIFQFSLFVFNNPVRIAANDIPASSILCPGDPVNLAASLSGGYPPYTFWWSNKDSNYTTTVTPNSTATYLFFATDTCGLDTVQEPVVVNVPVYPPLGITGVNDKILNCPLKLAAYGPPTLGGIGGAGGASGQNPNRYKFSWDYWQNQNPNFRKSIARDTTITVSMTDVCGDDTAYASATITIKQHPGLFIQTSPEVYTCPDDSVLIWAKGFEGGGLHEYKWSDGQRNDTVYVKSSETEKYIVTVYSDCDTSERGSVLVNVMVPAAQFEHSYTSSTRVEFTNLSSDDAIAFHWDFGDAFSTEEDAIHDYSSRGPHEVFFTVENKYGCEDSVRRWIESPLIVYVPTAFSPNGDGLNDFFEIQHTGISEFVMEIFNRWNEVVFETNDPSFKWDGRTNGKLGELFYTVQYTAIGENLQVITKNQRLTLIGGKAE